MRVTYKLLSSSFLYNLDRNRLDLFELQTQIATSRRINRPSDDPAGVGRLLRLRSLVKRIEGYQSNIDEAEDWMSTTEGALREIWEIFSDVRTTLLRAADDSMDAQSRKALAYRVEQLLESLLQIANSQKEGRHIFGGTETQTTPYTASYEAIEEFTATYNTAVPLAHTQIEQGSLTVTDGSTTYREGVDYTVDYEKGTITVLSSGSMADGAAYQVDYRTQGISSVRENPEGISGKIYRAVGEGLTMQANITGPEVFGGEPDAFQVLIQTRDLLVRDDGGGIRAFIIKVDILLGRLDSHLADLGTRIERMEATRQLLDRERLNAQGLLDAIEGTDIAQAIVELQRQEAIYRAALQLGSRVVQPSLVDFLEL